MARVGTPVPTTSAPDAAGSARENPVPTHTVARGESLWRIAQDRLGQSARWKEIFDLNPELTGPTGLRTGQVLRLPADARTGGSEDIDIAARTGYHADGSALARFAKRGPTPRTNIGDVRAGGISEAAAAADRIYKAIKGMGTDEAAIFAALAHRSPDDIAAIKAAYEARSGHTLERDLRGDLSGLELDRARALLRSDQVDADALGLEYAFSGLNTDEALVIELLQGRGARDLDVLAAAYAQRTGRALRDDVRAHLSGEDLRNAESLLADAPPLGSPAFDARLDALTGSRAKDGNSIELLPDGKSSFAERNRLIDSATTSIHFQTFIFNSDQTGWDLARRLAKKASEGVSVRVIYDALGSNRADEAMFEYMRKAGVELRAYAPVLSQPLHANSRWHEKHLIVDGRVSVEGGMNIADEYALGGSGHLVFSRGTQTEAAWTDVDARVEGPAVADAQRAFVRNWDQLGEPIAGDHLAAAFPPLAAVGRSRVRVVQHRPHEDGDHNTTALYLQAIRSAQHRISIENAYFVPPPEIRNELIAAARRGVEVRILTNSATSTDMGFVSDAARYFYDELIAAGAQIYETKGGTLHSKVAAFDDAYAIVGSANLNGRSDARDSEVALGIEGAETSAALHERIAKSAAAATRVTAGDLEKESFWTNLKQWSLSCFAWTL